jgi:glycosyltransferase involved in cell wall biosynthesis
MNNKLKISVITPTLNQGEFIKDTIDSILLQNYENIEHIIIDGGSSDNTINILKSYSHLIWISEPDKGASDAINKGLKMATGEVLTWLNSDDYYYPDVLSDVAEIFEEMKLVNFVYGNITFVNKSKEIILKEKTVNYNLKDLINNNADTIRQPCSFFRKRIIEDVGLLNEDLKCVFDYDLFIRIFRKTIPFYIDKDIVYVRDYNDTLSRKNFKKQRKEIIGVARKYGAKYYNKNVWKNYIKMIVKKK